MLAVQQLDVHRPDSSDRPGPAVSISDAADLCEVSVDTIRRRLRAGLFDGAYRDGPSDAHPWVIPVRDLIRIGLCSPTVLENLDDRLNPSLHRLANQLIEAHAATANERTRRESAEKLLAQANSEVAHLRRTVDRLLDQSGSSSLRVSA